MAVIFFCSKRGIAMRGLKFKYLAFDKIVEDFKGISINIDGKEIASGDFSEVLKVVAAHPDHLETPEYEVTTTRAYFNIFVIELESLHNQDEIEEPYVCSATNGDYSPSNPWEAPGMSIKGFI